MHVMLSCVDCVNNYFDSEGRPHSARDFSHVLREPCSVRERFIVLTKLVFFNSNMYAHG